MKITAKLESYLIYRGIARGYLVGDYRYLTFEGAGYIEISNITNEVLDVYNNSEINENYCQILLNHYTKYIDE